VTLSIRCPQCKTVHTVGDEMAGQRAKCRCGAIMVVPQKKAAPAPSQARTPAPGGAAGGMTVRCPSCKKTHRVSAAMAGTTARCTCGAVLKIPRLTQPGAPAAAPSAPARSTIWDELNEDQWAVIEGRQIAKPQQGEDEDASPAASMFSGVGGANGLWRDGKRLVCSRDARFPGRSVKTNEPTDNRVTWTFSYCPPWVYIVFGALIAMFFIRKFQVDVAIEQRWVTRRIIHALSGVGAFLLGGLMTTVAGASAGDEPGAVALVFLLMGIFLSFSGLIYALVGGRALSTTYVDDIKQHAWIKGADPNYLETLPVWDGPHH
jgi:ribosomal protein S27E